MRVSGQAPGLALLSGPPGWHMSPAPKGGFRRCFLRSGLCGVARKDLRCSCGWRGPAGHCAAFQPGRYDIFTALGAPGARVTAWRGAGARGSGIRRGHARPPMLGEDHPHTLVSASNLAADLRALGGRPHDPAYRRSDGAATYYKIAWGDCGAAGS